MQAFIPGIIYNGFLVYNGFFQDLYRILVYVVPQNLWEKIMKIIRIDIDIPFRIWMYETLDNKKSMCSPGNSDIYLLNIVTLQIVVNQCRMQNVECYISNSNLTDALFSFQWVSALPRLSLQEHAQEHFEERVKPVYST